MYQLIRKILFCFDAEKVHHFSMRSLQMISRLPYAKKWLRPSLSPKPVHVFGLHFKNALGLAAGFDKNAKYLKELDMLGFGFVEIGTVTPVAQNGNPTPRLFRLPKDKAVLNRMGFNNEGLEPIIKRLKKFRSATKDDTDRIIIGGNIGKNKNTPNENAWQDYEKCFQGLFEWVDYFVVNVSSPNTPGLRDLQQKDSLRKILTHLQSLQPENHPPRPLLLKISPDLAREELDDIIDLAMEINLDGLVATNTTIDRKNLLTSKTTLNRMGAGGISGLPLNNVSSEICAYIFKKTGGRMPIISSGGIFTSSHARERMINGASLVQIWTGFIYEGPSIVKKIARAIS